MSASPPRRRSGYGARSLSPKSGNGSPSPHSVTPHRSTRGRPVETRPQALRRAPVPGPGDNARQVGEAPGRAPVRERGRRREAQPGQARRLPRVVKGRRPFASPRVSEALRWQQGQRSARCRCGRRCVPQGERHDSGTAAVLAGYPLAQGQIGRVPSPREAVGRRQRLAPRRDRGLAGRAQPTRAAATQGVQASPVAIGHGSNHHLLRVLETRPTASQRSRRS
mgnify:CR=1 FL=1